MTHSHVNFENFVTVVAEHTGPVGEADDPTEDDETEEDGGEE